MNSLRKYDPFAELNALQRQFFGDDWLSPLKGVNIPTTDVFIRDNELVIEAHLPNFTHENIDIKVDNNMLTISAKRVEKDEDKDRQYVVRESSSSFYRSIQLPERANADSIDADLESGILTVKVPLEPLPEPKRIEVKSRKNAK